MGNSNKSYLRAYIAAFLGVLLFLILYLIKFHGSLSNKSSDWASFGSYIGGTAMLVLTALNIFIFVRLTKAISKSDEDSKKKELAYQKKLILAQMRQKELGHFADVMEKAMCIKEENTNSKMIYPIITAISYINMFINCQGNLFDIENSDNTIKKELSNLHKSMVTYKERIEKVLNYEIRSDGTITDNQMPENVINKTLEIKDRVIFNLQKLIIDDLENL